MADPISRTAHGDAPLSTARKPNPEALNGENLAAEKNDVLVGRTVLINRPRAQLYEFWRDFANLPQFMHNIESVTAQEANRSRWVVSAPAGKTVEWDSIITADEPNRMIAWQSVKGADIRNSGRVEFRDSSAGRGTEVSVTITYDPPVGALGKLVAKLFQREPKIQARQDLRRFKQLMETGEVATSQPQDAAPRKE
jgi:uncharacterized membrane protein